MAGDESGYIFLWRKIREHKFWKEPRKFSLAEAWIDILLEVRWSQEPQEVSFGMTTITCGYGQSLNSLDTWARRWRWSRSRVQRFFAALRNERMIDTEDVRKTIRITVCNFKQYQKSWDVNETQMKRSGDADETQLGTEKKRNKGKKVKKEKTLSPELLELSKSFLQHQVAQGQIRTFTEAMIDGGADTVDKLVRIDGYDLEQEVKPVLRWAVSDSFWKSNLLSLAGLRGRKNGGATKFENIRAKMTKETDNTDYQAVPYRDFGAEIDALERAEKCGK